MTFLIDTLRNGLKSDEDDQLDDLNFVVGNTSGLDIGNVPSPIDQRIGRMAQIGGSIMEIQISNPATFQIDRPELMNVINQLGYEAITLHGDPNIGFTGAYATRGQGITGYNIVHRYFKRYLEQMASFRWEAGEQKSKEEGFDVGYVNMHASNEMIPAREERMASDVSVDPFGFQVTNISGDKDFNIYENEEFLEKLFDYFFLQAVEQPWRQYEQIFSDEDENFRKEWNEQKAVEADYYFYGKKYDTDFEDQVALFQTAASIDAGGEEAFLNKLDDHEFDEGITVTIQVPQGDGEPETTKKTYKNLAAISNYFRVGNARSVFDNPGRLARDIYELKEENLNPSGSLIRELVEELDIKKNEEAVKITDYPSTDEGGDLQNTIGDLIGDIWGKGARNDSDLSAEGKLSALSRNLDIQNTRIYEEAQERVEDAARTAFSKRENKKILENLTQGRVRDDFNKESSLFFHILPAWMQASDKEVPKFIWESTLRQSVKQSDETDSAYFEGWDEFERFLDERRENELDVIAAVAACYLWGHWTQKRDRFEQNAFDIEITRWDGYEMPELKDGDEGEYTWIEWMNEFDLRVNIEAMYGSPGELRRLWRPKDIAIACHAINMQAREDLGDDYDENLVKFTIDMEHTASYGVDPWDEMQRLIENEKALAKTSDLDIDPEKPLAKIVKTYHLTKPGWEQQQGHRHGPFTRGDETLYTWLYHMVENGFARNEEDEARIIFEVGGEYREEIYVTKVAMDMVKHGIAPEEVDEILNDIPLNGEFETVEQELVARFFGMDKASYNREWAKVEEHAFDPLDDLLQARGFDDTFSGSAAIEQGQARPQQWKSEEYR